jgi:hypothetical protein
MQSKYTDLLTVAINSFSITPHGAVVEARISIGREHMGWRLSKMAAENVSNNISVLQYVQVSNGMLGGHETAFDTRKTDNKLETINVAEERKIQSLAKVHNVLELSHGSQNLLTTQEESRAEYMQMTAIGYISDSRHCACTLVSNQT